MTKAKPVWQYKITCADGCGAFYYATEKPYGPQFCPNCGSWRDR